MTRRDISLTLALCASLTVHALLLASAAEWYTRQAGSHIWLPGFAKPPQQTAMLVVPPIGPDEEDPRDRLGDSTGRGKAIGDAPGELPLMAPKASQDQPFLSLDPAGPGRVGDVPTDSLLPLGRAGALPQPTTPPREQQPVPLVNVAPTPPPIEAAPPAIGFGKPASDLADPFVPAPAVLIAAAPVEQEGQPKPDQDPKPDQQPQPPQEALSLAQNVTAAPEMPPVDRPSAIPGAEVAADPAPAGSTESDPTTTIGSVDFRAGSTEVRLGRKFKLTRPRIGIVARQDLMTRASPIVVLKLNIDETGKVTSAKVYRSSGSIHIDQPCQLAAYEWWFEPLKDKNGKPQKDVILFTISFIG